VKLSQFLNGKWRRNDRRRQGRPVSRRVSLALEILEDRTVPSTVPVLGRFRSGRHFICLLRRAGPARLHGGGRAYVAAEGRPRRFP